MQISEAVGELHFLTVDENGSKRPSAGGAHLARELVLVNGQQPRDVGVAQGQPPLRPGWRQLQHGTFVHGAEQPYQQVEEVYADVGHDTSRARLVALPRVAVPRPTGCDVAQRHLVPPGFRLNAFAQGDE